jgi:hypothetical protein
MTFPQEQQYKSKKYGNCAPAAMLAAAAVVQTTSAEPCLPPRVCSTAPLRLNIQTQSHRTMTPASFTATFNQ